MSTTETQWGVRHKDGRIEYISEASANEGYMTVQEYATVRADVTWWQGHQANQADHHGRLETRSSQAGKDLAMTALAHVTAPAPFTFSADQQAWQTPITIRNAHHGWAKG